MEALTSPKQKTLEELQLKRISDIEEALNSESFIVDTMGKSEDAFFLYPAIHGKARLVHNLLNLYGIHWRYSVQISEPTSVSRLNGDYDTVLDDKRNGKKVDRRATYAFTQKYIDSNKSL